MSPFFLFMFQGFLFATLIALSAFSIETGRVYWPIVGAAAFQFFNCVYATLTLWKTS